MSWRRTIPGAAFAVAVNAMACQLILGIDSHDLAVSSHAKPDASVVVPTELVPTENESIQSGRVIRAQGTDGVAQASVSVQAKTGTTNTSGDYKLLVPRGAPYQMVISADGFYKLLDQEWIVGKGTLARGESELLPTEGGNLLTTLLVDRRRGTGIVIVKVVVMPPCTTEEGATLTMDPAGESKVAYFSGQLPNAQLTSVQAGATFSGIFYNVAVGVPLTVSVSSPSCRQAPFPIDADDVTYTGKNTALADEALSYHRVYLRDLPDAGSE